ncbi:MAG: hypothetical protein DRN13_03215 [Thermoplasmata archaeon]|nr:MAG: hypothetical protein DRN13_03215 [Thermoplasmata archaeon]HDO69739.1 hypothetical protein [Thermoplasmatales archaeon]HEX17654.1 hypothetical protein [Thermoplasmatales archaeon]
MKGYGSKTRIISISLLSLGLVFMIASLIIGKGYLFEGLISLSAVFLFSGSIIYLVIYRSFRKLEEIANDVEKGKL